MSNEKILNAFLKTVANDRVHGIARSLAEYQALWSGHEAAIERKYREIFEGSSDSNDTRATGKGFSVGSAAQRIGPYEIVRVIGRGGQGEVFLAQDTRIDRRVALKVLDASVTISPTALERFRREADLAARLDHPNLGVVFEAGTEGRTSYIATAFHPGGSLADDLEKRKSGASGLSAPKDRDALARLLRAFEKLARALDHAHARGVLHRDIKPSNVMLKDDLDPVLIDFGLARVIEESPDATQLTAAGDLFGTTPYLAPELLAGTGRPDRRTDLFAFGAMLYEALTGRRAFSGPTRQATVELVLASDPPRPSTFGPIFSRDLDAVVEAAIDKDPNRRYESAAALADDLSALAENRPVSVVRLSAPGRALRFAARRPLLTSLVFSIVIAFSIALVFLGLWVGDRPAVRETERRRRAEACDRLLEEATLVLHLRPLEDSARLIRAALEKDPESIEARVLSEVHEIAQRKGLSPSTLEFLKSRGHADLEEPLLALVDLESDRVAEAEKRLGQTTAPNDAAGHYLHAVIRLRIAHRVRPGEALLAVRKNEIAALDHLDIAVATAPAARRIYHLERLHAAHHVADRGRMRQVLAAAQTMCKDTAIGRFFIINALTELGDRATARRELELILSDPPTDLLANRDIHATLFVNYLLLLRMEKDEATLASASERFSATFPEYSDGEIEKVGLLIGRGDFDGARRLADELSAAKGRRPSTIEQDALFWRAVGQLAMRDRDFAKALAAMTKATEVFPGDADAWHMKGFLLLQSDPDAAAVAAQRALDVDPRRGTSWALLGAATKDEKKAEAALRRACASDRTANYAGHQLALLLEARGRFDEAMGYFKMSIAAGYEPARGRLATMLLDLGEIAAAESLAIEGRRDNPTDPYPAYVAALVARDKGDFAAAARLAEEAKSLAESARRPMPEDIDRLIASTSAMDDVLDDADLAAKRPVLFAQAVSRSARRTETLAAWQRAVEVGGDSFENPRSADLDEAIIDVLRAHIDDPDLGRRAAALAFVRRLLGERFQLWSEFLESDEMTPRDVLRRSRRMFRHVGVARSRDSAVLNGLSDADNLSWRQLWESLEKLNAAWTKEADPEEPTKR